MNVRLPKQGMSNNPQKMAETLKKMQEDMVAKQQELEAREYDVSVGGGVITVKITGKKEIKAIELKPEVVDPDDIETLSDLLVAAVNEAIKKVEDTNASEMQKITGDLNVPGLF